MTAQVHQYDEMMVLIFLVVTYNYVLQDEDQSHAWVYLHENDVVSILQQFPLDAVFTHLLQAPVDESGERVLT